MDLAADGDEVGGEFFGGGGGEVGGAAAENGKEIRYDDVEKKNEMGGEGLK